MTTVRVPASASNLGAGFDCLGLALDLWLEVRLTDTPHRIEYTGELHGYDARRDLIAEYLREEDLLERHGLAIHSDIPVARGLGSSAAAHVAARALREHLLTEGKPLDRAAIFRDTMAVEGHPDNAGPACFGGLVLTADGPRQLSLHEGIRVVLAVPPVEIETARARRLVPRDVPTGQAVQQAGRLAALVTGLQHHDPELIGTGMRDTLAVPYRASLIPGFTDAVAQGVDAGAYGVTISGSGSTVLAVTEGARTADVAAALGHALRHHNGPTVTLTPAVAPDGVTLIAS